jgi:uncharacterized protein YndB with AHSA1/START domain
MIHLKMSTMIYRPIKQVFDFVSMPENDFQWQYGTLATARLSEGISKKGTAFRSIGHLMGHRVQGTFEVIEYEPNKEYGFKSLSGPLHSQTLYTFEPANGGTKITQSTRAHLINFPKTDERLLGFKIKKQLKENLTLLKGLLEETVSSLATNQAAI